VQQLDQIKVRNIQKPYMANYYSLTEKGMAVAEKLCEVEEIIARV
jgi:hypothetical protein